MATLEKIRKRGKIIAIIIGLALFAFVASDLLTPGKSILIGSRTQIASVNGNSIDIKDYDLFIRQTEEYIKALNGMTNLDEQTYWQIRTSVWDLLIRQKILDKTFQKHNFYIGSEELKDITIGNNPHYLVQQTFADPQTGQFDKNFLIQILQRLQEKPRSNNPQELQQIERIRNIWLYIENYVKFDQAVNKYTKLLTKSLYTNKIEIENDNDERKRLFNIELVYKQIFDIPDDSVTVTDKDLRKYYDEHKNLFYNYEDKINLNYIEVLIKPLPEDTIEASNKAKRVFLELQKSDDPENVYVEGTKTVQFLSDKDLKYYQIDTVKFEKGKTLEPRFFNGAFYVFKILDVQERPDTVSARHILISPQNPKVGNLQKANQLADSLIQELQKGAKFEDLASRFSDDPGSKDKGGLYENFPEGQMVPEFNNYCFSKKIGEIGKVETQFGVHIIEVTAQKNKKLRPKYLTVKVEIFTTDNTFKYYYTEVAKLRSEMRTAADFDSVAQKHKINIKSAYDLTKGSYSIPGISNAREIIRWAFNTDDINQVSQIFTLQDRYIIAVVADKKEIGYTPLKDVKKQIEISVKMKKKVEMIYSQYFANANINDIDALAKSLNVQKISVPNVSFNAFQIQNIGYEPAVLAAIYTTKEPKTIGPIKGENGVYVVKITEITQSQPLTNEEFEQQRKRMNSALSSRAEYQYLDALKKKAKIIDNRQIYF